MKNYIPSSLSFSVMLLFSASLIAQPYSRERGTAVVYTPGSAIVQIYKSDEVSGTPFYKEDFVPGKVILENDKATETMLIDFDGFRQNIIIKKNNQFKVLSLPNIKGFVFLDDNDEVEDYFVKGFNNPELEIAPDNFVKVIYDGKVKLIGHFKVAYEQTNFTQIVTGSTSNKYESELTYYIVRENGEYKKTRLRNKNLINDLGQFRNELKDYVKENNINGRTNKGAAEILIYYETLLENS